MSEFQPAVEIVLKHEGGFFDRSETTGEVVSMGITLATLRAVGVFPAERGSPPTLQEIQFIKSINATWASDFYKKQFWDPQHLGDLNCQKLAAKVFDLSVNMGKVQAGYLFQRAINKDIWPAALHEDGIIGPQTIQEANSVDCSTVYDHLIAGAAAFYNEVAEKHPELAENLNGWLARLNS